MKVALAMRKLLLFLLLSTAVDVAAESPYAQSPRDPIPPAYPDSPLIQRLMASPLGEGRDASRAQSLLVLSWHARAEGETLRLFLQRRALKRVLGERLEVSGTVSDAIAAERADAEKFQAFIERALGTVVIDYAPRKAISPQPSPEARRVGNGIWVQTDQHDRFVLHMPVVIRNGLQEAASEVDLQIGATEGGGPKPYYLYLQCKPQDRPDFPPGLPQPALCTGRERVAMNMDGVVGALGKREARLQTARVAIRSGDFFKWYFRQTEDNASGEAKSILQGASCRDRGTCAEEEKQAAQKAKTQGRPHIFGGLALGLLVIAGAAAASVRPRQSVGVWAGLVAAFLVATSLAGLVAMWALLRPGVGYEGFLYAMLIYYMAIPHGLAVIVLASAVADGRVTRFRAFALTLGLLAPALVLAAFAGYT